MVFFRLKKCFGLVKSLSIHYFLSIFAAYKECFYVDYYQKYN